MKLKTILVSVLLTVSSFGAKAMSDGEAALLGIVIGSQVYVQPAPVYIQRPHIYYAPRASRPRYNYYSAHAFCSRVHNDHYYYCMDDMQRRHYEESRRYYE